MPWSSLISAGGSLLGGLFGSSSAKKARARALEDEKQKFVRLREAAELGGFNPLTALENAGSTFGSNIPSGAAPLASIQMITNAITEVGNELTGVNAQQRARDELELDLAKLKLDQMRHSANRALASGLPRLGKSGASLSTQAVSTPPTKFKTGYSDERTSIMIGGQRLNPDKDYDDAEHVEKRVGDVGSALYGLWVGGADLYNTFLRPRYEARATERKYLQKLRDMQSQEDPRNREKYVPPRKPTIGTFRNGGFTGFPLLRSY